MDATDPTPGAAAPLDPASLPAPVVRPPRRARVPLVWLVPAIAALAGLVLIVRTYLRTGPSISIAFETAEGLEAGKTEVKYKNVVVGRVKNIALSLDRKQVLCTVELTADAASIAVEDTRFWVERPRVGLGGISGISTLLSTPM